MLTKEELPKCPVATTVYLIGNKWTLLILRELIANNTLRFGQIKKNIDGISQKVLTQNLRELESNGIVKRHVYAEVPPKVEYSLTNIGNTLIPVMDVLAKWGEEYKTVIDFGSIPEN
ncbi:MAG: helix-turn-helix transcriptional regulator [Mucispirillum sp.]|nr:helix-turn-helix transcriptional regulator [Mucispirillum sp.]